MYMLSEASSCNSRESSLREPDSTGAVWTLSIGSLSFSQQAGRQQISCAATAYATDGGDEQFFLSGSTPS